MLGKYLFPLVVIFIILTSGCSDNQSQKHRKPQDGEIEIIKPGYYTEEGKTYILTKDISCDRSAIFLANNTTLDLNGYTIRYADGNYRHIRNYGFEEDLKGWDVSKAPGAKIMNTADVHVFLGEKLLSLKAGDEVVSSYVKLSVPHRSYFAMCGITGHHYHDMDKYPDDEMRISIFVEDEEGNNVDCDISYSDGTRKGCPVENQMPRLGGGFIFAHLYDLSPGKYRIRVKAENDCLIDEVDIRPAMDVGIGIVDKTIPLAHYFHLSLPSYPPILPAFYDYTEDVQNALPLKDIPRVSEEGLIVIKNGAIECGADGVLTWGIQSTAGDAKIMMKNLKIKTQGISSGAAFVRYADIDSCRFEVDMPFLIQRHVGLCSVVIRGDSASEISNSEFIGGQGCLSIPAPNSLIHDNLFVNKQTTTNHYSIMGTGKGSKIYSNRFEPEQGSGIYVSKYTEVYDNIFKIETSPPTCEYGREEYSVAAVRLGDYGAAPGSPRASIGNKIHDNKIFITAKNYPDPDVYIPMAWGIFYSASGGENFVYNNEFTVNKTDVTSKVKTAALYICGGPRYFGGQFYNNKITTNVPAAWVASMYGGASNSKLFDNTIVALDSSKFPTFTIGSEGCETCYANNVEFSANEVQAGEFSIQTTNQKHSYTVSWKLKLKILDSNGLANNEKDVIVLDRNNKEYRFSSDSNGEVIMLLPEYKIDSIQKTIFSPYTVKAGDKSMEIEMNANTEITIHL